MGWNAPLLKRAAAIALVCAVAMMFARAAYAQGGASGDGFGLAPVAAPTTPVQQSSLTDVQRRFDPPPAPANSLGSNLGSSPASTSGISQSAMSASLAAAQQVPANSGSGMMQQAGAASSDSSLQNMSTLANPASATPAPGNPAPANSTTANANAGTPNVVNQQTVSAPVPTATAAAQTQPRPAGTPYGMIPMPWDTQAAQGYGYAPLRDGPQAYGYAPLPGTQGAAPAGYGAPPPGYGGPQGPQPGGPQAPAPYNAQAGFRYDANAYYAASGVTGYLLGPGDKLHMSIYGEDDLSGDYQVDGSGLLRLPLVGTVRAAGYTTLALEGVVAAALAQGYLKSPRVNIEIVTYRPFYIIGAVGRPGQYGYVNNMTALDAVALGGGFTDKANQDIVFVRHEGSPTEQEMPASQLTRVWPGDVIRVNTTWFWDTMDVLSPLAAPATFAAQMLR